MVNCMVRLSEILPEGPELVISSSGVYLKGGISKAQKKVYNVHNARAVHR